MSQGVWVSNGSNIKRMKMLTMLIGCREIDANLNKGSKDEASNLRFRWTRNKNRHTAKEKKIIHADFATGKQ